VCGKTFHSYFIIDTKTNKCRASLLSKKCDVFIIDEISMVGKSVFETVFHYLKSSRLIVFGDFAQLTPINDTFVLESKAWEWFKFHQFNLEKIFRQSDENFINLLGKLREYPYTCDVFSELKKFENKQYDDTYIYLFGTNLEKDNLNKSKLDLLTTPEKKYKAIDPKLYKNTYYKEITKIIPQEISIKVGCRVMCVKNITIDEYYIYNGCVGTVDFCSNTCVSVLFDIYPNKSICIERQKMVIPCDKTRN